MSAPLLPVADARHKIVSSLQPLGTESIELTHARGRVLAANAIAQVSHPPADVSAMDGYAVRSSDILTAPTTLKVVGESAAGHPWAGEVKTGEAVRIFTGAYIPVGADTIVIQENTTRDENTVLINEISGAGKNIRPKGQDFQVDDSPLTAPRRLSSRDIGLLAAMNLPKVSVFRRPRVGILSTGDEIVQPGEPLGNGQIVSANGPGLTAFVESRGGIAMNLGVIPDKVKALQDAIEHADPMDILITSGGVSVGDHDLIQKSAGAGGLKITFHKIAMRPGKPLLFGQFKQLPFLGLPGNPVSAMVCAVLFLDPALDALQGLPGRGPEMVAARLGAALAANDGREDYIRAVMKRSDHDLPLVEPLPKQDSAMIAALAKANALIVRPPHAPSSDAGDVVRVIPLA